MNFAVIKPALLAIVQSLSGLDAVWKDRTGQYTNPATRGECRLKIASPKSVGWDEIRTTYDTTQAVGKEMIDTVCGVREFVLSIEAVCLDQGDDTTAFTFLEHLRTRMSWRSTRETLRLAQLSCFRDGTVIDLSKTVDKRWASMAALDLSFRTPAQEQDPDQYGYIDEVEGTSTLEPGSIPSPFDVVF